MTSSPARATTPPHLRRARLGVSVIFFTNGIVLGGFAPRVPEMRDQLGVSYGTLGAAMAMWSVGALLLGLLAAPLIRRFRSSRVATLSMVASATALLAAGLSQNVWLFGAALFVVGATDAFVDVAQNAHGLRVQRLYKRSIFNAFHALWSAGAVSGGLIGGLSAGLGVSVGWQFALLLAVVAVANAAVYPMLLPGPEPQHAGEEGADEAAIPHAQHLPLRHVPVRTWALLGALTVIAIAGGWAEDAASTWSASYMRDELLAGATLASLAFVAMQGCQFVGRLLGDGMVDRWGQRTVARWGGALVAVGMGLALAFPSPWGTIAGFGAAGFGVATLIPGAMHAADELPGLRTGTGLTILSWLLRLAFLLSPPVVGWIADATSLRVGLTLVPVFGLLVVLLAGAMATRKAPAAHQDA
ncbi:MFS transporter [Demequina mangrovi]|uniref:Predicted arabinose efflux permease, MFS family n=1 Tax=Demequina mangrovi TaxID=1043493 RepID=A0A1H6UZR8_9MICO|nr:MFS transporter [Demequina mangrovi]SEI97751.1 Predicted arabinose efflux permease, MFS family [Demequina mangrovi]